MTKKTGFALGVRCTVVVLAAAAFAACPKQEEPSADGFVVTSSSEAFRTVARNLQEPCNQPAEFGRCECTLDGFRTPCEVAARCLELGFCEVAATADAGTRVTTDSETFRAAANHLAPACNQPAEFGRCECTLDGSRTSCDLVARCLELGFCVAVAG